MSWGRSRLGPPDAVVLRRLEQADTGALREIAARLDAAESWSELLPDA